MATASDPHTSGHDYDEEDSNRDYSELKKDLEGWREALLPLSGFLTWEKPYYPAVIVGIITFLFALLWYLEPSVLTTFSLLGLTAVAVDFAVPIVGPRIFANKPWTGSEERQFDEICQRIANMKGHCSDFVEGMAILKSENPKVYFLVVMITLGFFAWIGHIINNLFLTYLIVLVAFLIPGLRKHGIIQRYLLKYWLIVKRMLFGRLQVIQRKRD
ncbi:hypothetical protein BaRGS_00000784 [Batillaria attramentaria]|uniref:RETREG1-3/ARL6IP-like N-terminal reticulon-homology domain-containing protein n=1 Tax=Batillaria attramentaria TaxID=370345 RepID=A0ABD0M8S1_9CAEN